MPFTIDEAVDMLAVYFECFQNQAVAAREYALRYPNRRHYNRRVFPRLLERLRATGSLYRPAYPRRRTGRSEENVINVLAYIEFAPHVSIRTLSLELGITRSTVHNIIKEHRLHPYHVVLHQALTIMDFDRRLDYCHWLMGMVNENPQFLSTILWTDEATFNSDGGVNFHNMHFWAAENPHWMQEVQHQGRWSVNVWCGIIGGTIVGPYFFEQALTGNIFLEFLRNTLPVLLENVNLELRQNMFLQLDGCPAHFAINVREHLNAVYPNRWIGRGSLFFWPARSPDLTVLDFYFWGRIKDLVFQTRPTTRENLIFRIQNAIHGLPIAEIETAIYSTLRRVQQCVEQDGGHFEHLGRH